MIKKTFLSLVLFLSINSVQPNKAEANVAVIACTGPQAVACLGVMAIVTGAVILFQNQDEVHIGFNTHSDRADFDYYYNEQVKSQTPSIPGIIRGSGVPQQCSQSHFDGLNERIRNTWL